MMYAEKEYLLKNNRVCTLRSAAVSDAAVMVEFLQIINEETYFMLRYPEEITLTEEEEITILKNWEEQPNKLLLLALIDGEIAGNCGIAPIAEHLKTKHRGRFGFTEWGRLPHAYKLKDGSYRDEINMVPRFTEQ